MPELKSWIGLGPKLLGDPPVITIKKTKCKIPQKSAGQNQIKAKNSYDKLYNFL